MSSLPRTFRTTLGLSLDHGGQHEAALVLTYAFTPGYPASHDESAQPDAAEILTARIVPPTGAAVDAPSWLLALIEADEALHAALVDDARDGDASERAEVAHLRREEARLLPA